MCQKLLGHPVEEDGIRQPIGYWSQYLNDDRRNCSASERECLMSFRHYKRFSRSCIMKTVTVFTGHHASNWLFNITGPPGRLTRWKLRLAEFYFKIDYKNGANNCHTDALSRLLFGSQTVAQDDDDTPAFQLAHDLDISSSKIRSDCSHHENHTKEGREENFSKLEYEEYDHVLATRDVRENKLQFAKITLEQLISTKYHYRYYYAICSRLNDGKRLSLDHDDNGLLWSTDRHPALPQTKSACSEPLPVNSDYPGGGKLYCSIKRHFYWPALAEDCYATVRNCAECTKNHIKLHRNVAIMKFPPATAPLESVSVDIFGELIRTPLGHRYILVTTDQFTKLVKASTIKEMSTVEVAKLFLDHATSLTRRMLSPQQTIRR